MALDNAKKSLNRTFYGIETACWRLASVLVVCLNRTFYGIETEDETNKRGNFWVLIVPFMELKHTTHAGVVIVCMS